MSLSCSAVAIASARSRAVVPGAPLTGSTTMPALSGGVISGEFGGGAESSKGCGSGWQAESTSNGTAMSKKRMAADTRARDLGRKADGRELMPELLLAFEAGAAPREEALFLARRVAADPIDVLDT